MRKQLVHKYLCIQEHLIVSVLANLTLLKKIVTQNTIILKILKLIYMHK